MNLVLFSQSTKYSSLVRRTCSSPPTRPDPRGPPNRPGGRLACSATSWRRPSGRLASWGWRQRRPGRGPRPPLWRPLVRTCCWGWRWASWRGAARRRWQTSGCRASSGCGGRPRRGRGTETGGDSVGRNSPTGTQSEVDSGKKKKNYNIFFFFNYLIFIYCMKHSTHFYWMLYQHKTCSYDKIPPPPTHPPPVVDWCWSV